MLDSNFCSLLEYRISKSLKTATDKTISGFWCDGIALSGSENNYSSKSVNDNRRVNLTAFIGKDGQTPYLLILKFGNKALSRYSRDLDIRDCIPTTDDESWLQIDSAQKVIEVQLY